MILQDLSQAELIAKLQASEAALAQLKADTARKLTCKVTEKGGVSVYGLGRFPVTLYRSQWENLIAFTKSGAVERFIAANTDRLSTKE